MRKASLPLLIISFLLSAGTLSCATDRRQNDSLRHEPADQAALAEKRAEDWADSVMSGMSLQLRVGQLFMPAVFTATDNATMNLISDYADRLGVGGIVLLKGNIESAAGIADSISRFAPIPLFIAVDAETGLSMRFSDAPEFLWNSQISADADTVALADYGREVARECRLTGINMILGPVLDVVPDSLASFKGASIARLRSFGNDAGRVASLGVAYASGLEREGVISVAKHFPGHGRASADSHSGLAEVRSSAATVESVDLLPFRRYVDAGLSAVMVGHIYNAALDSVARPATFSSAVISSLLRDRMGFRGLILTDAINMGGAQGYTAVDAFRAGADIVLAPRNTEREIADVCEAVETGKLDISIISDRCRRVLKYKYIKGIAVPRRRKHQADMRNLIDSVHRGARVVRDRLRSR